MSTFHSLQIDILKITIVSINNNINNIKIITNDEYFLHIYALAVS